jgi:hypothetical protein
MDHRPRCWWLSCCMHVQAIGKAGSSFVKFFAGIDRKAENAGVFPKLAPSPVPEEVVDSDGSVDNSVEDVRHTRLPPVKLNRHQATTAVR